MGPRDDFIHERTRQLYDDYQYRRAAEKRSQITPQRATTFGPDWRGKAEEMKEKVRALRELLTSNASRSTDGQDT